MTGYEQFINNPELKQGKSSILFELEVSRAVDNMIDFTENFLDTRGFKRTGHSKETHQPIFNNLYEFAGAVQDGDKVAIRLNQM